MNRRIVCCLLVVAVAVSAFAVERRWIGPETGGLWRDAANWDPTGMIGADDVPVFDREGTFEIGVAPTPDPNKEPYNYLAGLKCEKGTVRLYNTGPEGEYKNFFRLKSAGEGSVRTNDIYVAGDAYLIMSNAVIGNSHDRALVRKTGAGTLEMNGYMWGNDWGRLAGYYMEEGTFLVRKKTMDYVIAGKITVGSGAVFKTVGNYIFNSGRLTVEAGGLYDASGYTIYLDEFKGDGVLTNISSILNFNLNRGRCRFGGHIYPKPGSDYATITMNARASGVAEDDWQIALTSPDAFSQVKFEMGNSTGAPLRFASGVDGEFRVGRIQGNDKPYLILEDENGNPVRVRAQYTNAAKFRAKGSGTFTFAAVAATISKANASTDVSEWTGTLASAGTADVVIGNKTAAGWPVMDENLSFHSGKSNGNPIYFYAPSDTETVLAGSLTGNGTYGFYGKLKLLACNTAGSWWQVRDNADLTIAGGRSALGGYGLYMYTGSKLTVTNGAYVGAADTKPTYGFDGNVLKQNYGCAFDSGRALGKMVIADGGHIVCRVPSTSFDLLEGGILETLTNPEDSAGTWSFDGGTWNLNMADNGFNFYTTPTVAGSHLVVGPKGLTIRCLAKTYVYSSGSMQIYFRRPFEASDTGNGGIVRKGGGFMDFWYPATIRGTFANLDGTLRIPNKADITGATEPLFGTGDFRLGNARIEYSDGITSAFTAQIGTGGRFIYDGAATIRVRESVNRPIQTLQLGTLTRGGAGAALYFLDTSAKAYNASGANVTFTIAPATTADGRIDQPVFTYGYGDHHNEFASYSATEGLKAFTNFTDWASADATKTVITPKTVTHVTADTAVGALMVRGIKEVYDNNAPLWIDAGKTLTVGNGTSPACVILRQVGGWGQGKINGAGTLDFGACEGVIVADRIDHEYAAVNAKIAGSGGLTLTGVSLLGENAGIWLGGANTYTGTTRIYSTKAMPKTSGAFGASVVEIGNGELQGGTLKLRVEGLTVTNAIRAAGWGYRAGATDDCAIAFEKNGAVSGSVEVYDEVRFSASSGKRGTFTGPVSGQKIWIWKGAGEICFAAANTSTGGVEIVGSTLVLTDAGTAGTGDIRLNNGTLVLENGAPKTVANRIYGKGKVRLAGRGAVNLPDLVSEDGVGFTLDLAARLTTINSLKEIASITTSRTAPTALIVTDGDITSYSGTLPANVTLYRPGEYHPKGFSLIIR